MFLLFVQSVSDEVNKFFMTLTPGNPWDEGSPRKVHDQGDANISAFNHDDADIIAI